MNALLAAIPTRLMRALAALVVLCICATLVVAPASAQNQQTGTLTGTITGADGKPLPGVTVSAIAPSSRYSATTDGRGFFAIAGVSPDTYDVTFSKGGYQSFDVQGVTVVPGQAQTISQKLQTALTTIGRSTSRSAGSAFNPTASSDTYTVTEKQINQLLGKSNNESETDLLAALPGVTIDSSGYPVLRGGRENEEGFQFEGIDYTDAFTHQFVNSLSLNGQSQLQLTPGSGDASTGNAGTGAINLVAKRGTSPAFGQVEYEQGSPGSLQQFSLENGIASGNGKFSNYASYIYNHDQYASGYGHQDALSAGNYFGEGAASGTNFVDNFIYKFGRDNNQSFQIFSQIQTNNFLLNSGGFSSLLFPSADPTYLGTVGAFTGLTNAQTQALTPLAKGQTFSNEGLDRSPMTYYQPNATIKFQYSWNIDPTAYITAKYFQVSSVVDFDFPYDAGYTGLSPFESSFDLLQGGQRTGFGIDGSKQIGEKNLLTFGGQFQWLHPVYSFLDPTDPAYFLSGPIGGSNSLYDFVNTGNCPLTGAAAGFAGAGTCGYLASRGFANAQLPVYDQYAANANRQDSDLYISDVFSPTTKLKITAGVRVDGTDYRLPSCNINTCLPTNTIANADGTYTYSFAQQNNTNLRPFVPEPRFSINYLATPADAIRLQYGRAVQFASISLTDTQINPAAFAQYANVPAYAYQPGLPDGGYNAVTNTPDPVVACGTNRLRVCTSYADQLLWQYQSTGFGAGIPIQPVAPAVFTNLEGSYSHDFGKGLSLKVTPFYRLSTNDYASVATPYVSGGKTVINPNTGGIVYNPPVATNFGVNKTTGVEFYITKDNPRPYGFSGQLSATYINELSNVIPTSPSEDFFPSIPTQSLALGNLYRVGFLSPLNGTLALTYQTRGGFKINPIIRYNHGYPIGQGLNTPVYIGTTAVNVPNTNITDSNGSAYATTYVDPQNPGALQNPNVTATRGTAETSSAGGALSQAQLHTDLDLEYSSKHIHGTFGLFMTNLFNNVYGHPSINNLYQPVATGIGGPLSGINANTALGTPYTNYTAFGGSNPYLLFSNEQPLTFNLYYQLKF